MEHLLYSLDVEIEYSDGVVRVLDPDRGLQIEYGIEDWERMKNENDSRSVWQKLDAEAEKDSPSEENESLGKSSLLNQIWNEAQGCDDSVLEATIAFMRTLKDHRRE